MELTWMAETSGQLGTFPKATKDLAEVEVDDMTEVVVVTLALLAGGEAMTEGIGLEAEREEGEEEEEEALIATCSRSM